MESDSAMDSDSDAEAPEKRRMPYMYLFEAKINYNHRDWDATTYMRKYLDLRRYTLKQPELIALIKNHLMMTHPAPLTNHCQ